MSSSNQKRIPSKKTLPNVGPIGPTPSAQGRTPGMPKSLKNGDSIGDVDRYQKKVSIWLHVDSTVVKLAEKVSSCMHSTILIARNTVSLLSRPLFPYDAKPHTMESGVWGVQLDAPAAGTTAIRKGMQLIPFAQSYLLQTWVIFRCAEPIGSLRVVTMRSKTSTATNASNYRLFILAAI
jgi:hypothetical protein